MDYVIVIALIIYTPLHCISSVSQRIVYDYMLLVLVIDYIGPSLCILMSGVLVLVIGYIGSSLCILVPGVLVLVIDYIGPSLCIFLPGVLVPVIDYTGPSLCIFLPGDEVFETGGQGAYD